jgi:hypothetical protein
LGQPLNLTLVNDKRAAALVDPYDGEVLFASSTSPGYFDCYNKKGRAVRRCSLGGGPHVWETYGEQKQKLMGGIMQPHEEKSTHCHNEHNRLRPCVIV